MQHGRLVTQGFFLAFLALIGVFATHAYGQNAPAAPVCKIYSTNQFIAAWNERTSSLTIGSWHLPVHRVTALYEQDLDGPSIMIKIRGTAQGCLDTVEIWTRHDQDIGYAAFVAWSKLVQSFGVPATQTKDIFDQLGIAVKQLTHARVEKDGVVFQFSEELMENSFRAVVL